MATPSSASRSGAEPSPPPKTITQVFLRTRERPVDAIACRFKKNKEWRRLSWQECYLIAESIGAALLSYGLKKGDRVALMAQTRHEWWLADMGIMGAGFVTVPIYPNARPDEVAHVLTHSEAKVLIIENSGLLRSVESGLRNSPGLEKIIAIEHDSDLDGQYVSWEQFIEEGDQLLEKSAHCFMNAIGAAEPGDVASILYTSGTTGAPRGVVITHLQIMSEITDVYGLFDIDERDESLSFLPYSHVMGRIESWGAVWKGFTLNFAESIDKIRGNLKEIKPTILIAVPRIFEKIHAAILSNVGLSRTQSKVFQWAFGIAREVTERQADGLSLPTALLAQYMAAEKTVLSRLREIWGGRLRFAISGGAPLNPEIAIFFRALGLPILEGYGLTETTAAISVNTLTDQKIGTAGKPLRDVTLRFGEDGEVLVKSDKVMREYYKDPVANRESFVDGYFRTGDVGHLTDDGFLQITDRKKDLIKTAGGKYVAPQKLENLLKLHPLISQALIHGDQKKYIVVLLTLDVGKTVELAEKLGLSFQDFASLTQNPKIKAEVRDIVAQVNAKLASFETIKNFAILDQDFTIQAGELTPSLKVKRKFCDEKYKSIIEKLY